MFQIAIHAISVIKRRSAENLSKEFRVLEKKIAQSQLHEFGTANECEIDQGESRQWVGDYLP
jgi:hypothetical protein